MRAFWHEPSLVLLAEALDVACGLLGFLRSERGDLESQLGLAPIREDHVERSRREACQRLGTGQLAAAPQIRSMLSDLELHLRPAECQAADPLDLDGLCDELGRTEGQVVLGAFSVLHRADPVEHLIRQRMRFALFIHRCRPPGFGAFGVGRAAAAVWDPHGTATERLWPRSDPALLIAPAQRSAAE